MPTSELIHGLHWVVYIGSFLSLVLLLTRYYKVGTVYIGTIFLSQAIFNGCLLTKWQNVYRIKEGLLPIDDTMLASKIFAGHTMQITLSLVVVFLCSWIYFYGKHDK